MSWIKYTAGFLFILMIQISITYGQSRWVKSYHDDIDAPLECFIESYDLGYLLYGWHGSNYPKYSWLIKTDINGEILWEKTIGEGLNTLALLDMSQSKSGSIYLTGSSDSFDSAGDPIVLKLDSCGEKEWCRIFHTDNHHDFSSCIALSREGEPVVVLNETNPNPWIDPICLAKLSPDGELIWKHCYTTSDTSQRNEETYDLILTPDNGFLVTGFCYYEDPEIPDLWWPHPYFLKVDSTGNFEWETVVYKETNLHGGMAGSTTVSPKNQYYYSSISHYYYDTNLTSPALVKMDMLGNVIGVYDLVYGYKEGKAGYAMFINDSILAASAGWGNTSDDLWTRAVIIDTLGVLLNSTVLTQDLYLSKLQITYDGKLVYASNTYQNGQFDCYLTKLNQNLEDDTIYTRPFTYDSLCPYQIVSDTIVPDDCGLIVGIEEDEETGGQGEEVKWGSLDIWPNPAKEVLNFKVLGLSSGILYYISIYDIFGREVQKIKISDGQNEVQINVEGFPPGIYLAVLKEKQIIKANTKFIIVK